MASLADSVKSTFARIGQDLRALASEVQNKVTETNSDMVAEYRATSGATIPPPVMPTFENTFIEVATVGAANGSNVGATIPGGAFTTIIMADEVSDVNNLYNPTTGIYTVPSAGIYLMNGKVRLLGSDTSTERLGLGFNSVNNDGPYFQWIMPGFGTNPASGQIARTFNYSRIAIFPTGAQLRFYAYTQGTSRGINQAGMSVIRIA